MDVRTPNWSLIRAFLAVADAGSLSAAARRTGQSQPTLGRQIRALELCLGQPLFHRTARGQMLTPTGEALLPDARAMADSAARLALTAAGRSDRLHGTVRLTAARVVAQYLLPPMLARLRREEPGIEIELVASDTPENLLFREADIALRMFRPETGELVARRIAHLPIGLYAARDHLDRSGRPGTLEELLKMEFVGYDRSPLMLRQMAALGVVVDRHFFPLRCDDQLVHWALVRAGCGVGAMQRIVGDADPAVERIAPFLDLGGLPVWLTAPTALRAAPRIRRVADLLAREFGALPST